MASPATPDAQTIASAFAEMKLAYSSTVVGFIIATATYGIGVLQCYLYFKNYPKDNIALKITVLAMLMVDTAATALMADTIYDSTITHFGDLAYAAIIPPAYPWENLCQALLPVIAQCLFAWQIWGVSRNTIAIGVILLLSLTSFGLGIFVSYHIGRFTQLASLATRTIKIVTATIEGTSALCDILITITLIYELRSKRVTGISTTERMIDILIRYIIARGILTAITQIVYLAVNLAFPHQVYWQPLRQLLGKLYVNSVLASLNLRQSVRGKGQPENSGDLVLSILPTRSSAPNHSTAVFATSHSVSTTDISHRDEDNLGPQDYVGSVVISHYTPSLILR
ncbi:hypothetical protein K438DRAFT_1988796 [Mycena galopus ATCC 62051]|nr:hypothetical protein K438DRAFT_1988796 [Mycena galopus ATCC 62051]